MSKLLKCLFLIVFMIGIVVPFVKSQDFTEPQKEQIIKIVTDELDKEWDNRKDDVIRDVLNDIDYFTEFENYTGVTVGAVIAIFVVICIVPNLIIMLLIFLCCYCCGAFSKTKDTANYYNAAPTQSPPPFQPAVASKPVGPAVPPKPHPQITAYSPPPQAQAQGGSSMWPWGKEDSGPSAQYDQRSGVQNKAYNGQW